MSAPTEIEIRLKKVLFAADFSPSSFAAFPFAASLARQYGGEVILAHVTATSEERLDDSVVRATLEKLTAGTNTSLIATEGASDATQLLADHGKLCPTLLSIADTGDVDLVVIGTHGSKGFKKLLQGSNAEEIMRLSSKPVLIVGPNVSRSPEFISILCATDFSPAALHAFAYANSINNAYGGSLVLLHVNDGDPEERPSDATSNTLKFLEDAREQGDAELRNRIDVTVEFGERAERILEVAEARKADLIVLGVHSTKGIRARIRAHLPGSLVYEVISQARCPVLTVSAKAAPSTHLATSARQQGSPN